MEVYDFLAKGWDVAIVLDACRYDSFEAIYQEYLDGGSLEMCIGASCTTHWLQSVFPNEYPNIVYVSAVPWVNSTTPWNGFDPRGKFGNIWDVWDWGWDEQLGTVPPRRVTKAALKAREKYPHKRLIIHYLQPHYPYRAIKVPEGVEMHFDGIDGRDGRSESLPSRLSRSVNLKLEKLFGRPRFWRLRKSMGFNVIHIEEYMWGNYTPEQIKYFYEDNLHWVLKEVKKLLERLDGKFVVTADHGEAFGEQGEFFHPLGTTNPAVRQVPCWKSEPPRS